MISFSRNDWNRDCTFQTPAQNFPSFRCIPNSSLALTHAFSSMSLHYFSPDKTNFHFILLQNPRIVLDKTIHSTYIPAIKLSVYHFISLEQSTTSSMKWFLPVSSLCGTLTATQCSRHWTQRELNKYWIKWTNIFTNRKGWRRKDEMSRWYSELGGCQGKMLHWAVMWRTSIQWKENAHIGLHTSHEVYCAKVCILTLVNVSSFSNSGCGIDLDYCGIEWFALEMNRSFYRFWD